MRALCIAGDGGVDVRLMLPGTPDHWYADAVADSYIGELLEHHVKVYRYTPGFLHAKSIMVDREAAFVGSVNFDYRSFELHYECGVMLYGASAIESLLGIWTAFWIKATPSRPRSGRTAACCGGCSSPSCASFPSGCEDAGPRLPTAPRAAS